MVSDYDVPHIKHLYRYKNIRQFRDDIEFILKKYNPISLFDLLDFLKNGRSLPEKGFLLTFDDGFREIHDIVAPILREKGIHATFFINSAFIDNKTLCYQHKASILAEMIENMGFFNEREIVRGMLRDTGMEADEIKTGLISITYHQRGLIDKIAEVMNVDFNDYLLRKKPYLTSDQIKDLVGDGFTIGSHSIDHPLYELLTVEDQLYQTLESIKCIREKFSLNYGAFSFPHYDNNVSKYFFAKLSESGLVDVTFGTNGILKDSFSNNFQRVSLEKPLLPAKRILAYHFARKFRNLLTGKGEIVRK
jgi:peptidoglycan/xylan/chitin deacetylase (PgdA/CDA1 family)